MKTTNNQERPVTIRITDNLYQHYVNKALKRGQKEKRIVKISEVLREVLENGKNETGK